jgi:hypothetical protein
LERGERERKRERGGEREREKEREREMREMRAPPLETKNEELENISVIFSTLSISWLCYDQLPALVWDSILNLTIYPTRLTYAPWPKLKYKSTVLCDAKRYGRRFTHYSEAIVNVQKVK